MRRNLEQIVRAKDIPVPELPNSVLPADHSHVACLWECEECGAKAWWTGKDVINGSPMCVECDVDMILSKDNSLSLTGRELAAVVDLASIALADADIYDEKASQLGMCDADMKVLQEKLNVIRNAIRG